MPAPADFDHLHRRVLPERLATPAGHQAARDVRDVAPLAFRLPDGRAYRFTPDGGSIRIARGVDGATVVDLAEDAWRDFVDERATVPGLWLGRRVVVSGDAARFERWEPALRALLAGRPIFDPAHVDLRDLDGTALDVHRIFTPAAPSDRLRHQLAQAGYLLVRGLFPAAEIAALREVVERRAASARPGDGTSWWTRHADGTPALCRLIYLGLAEPRVAALSHDPRLLRLAALADEPLQALDDRSDGHTVVIKVPGATRGLADLPWHRDCGLGGHPILCPAVNVGIQLDAATEASGRLSFVPGTAGTSCHRDDLDRALTVAIDTEPGDCTVHLGDTVHAAPPPTGTGPGRRALYVTFLPARVRTHVPTGKSYNDVVLARVGR